MSKYRVKFRPLNRRSIHTVDYGGDTLASIFRQALHTRYETIGAPVYFEIIYSLPQFGSVMFSLEGKLGHKEHS